METWDNHWGDKDLRPLLQGMVIEAGGTRFRTERWWSNRGNCYEFIEVGDKGVLPFFRSPESVKKAMDEGKIKIVSNAY